MTHTPQHPPGPLSPQALQAIATLLGDLAITEGSIECKRRILCEGLAKQIGADGWIWSVGGIDSEHTTPINVALSSGGLTDEQAAALLNSISDTVHPSPINKPFIDRIALGKPFTVRRRDVVSDKEWYASENVKAYQLRQGYDELLGTVTPNPEGFCGILFFRFTGRDGFLPEHRDLIEFAVTSARWLCSAEPPSGPCDTARGLSPRLRSVLTLLLEGYLCNEIAECYSLSPHTVKGYIRDIYRHFDVHSQLSLIRLFRSQA